MTGSPAEPAAFAPVPADDDRAPLMSVLGEADRIGGILRVADGLATASRAIDLAGLDTRVGLLCARALELRPDHRQQARCRLVLLLTELDRLSHRLRGAENARG